jgi:hypothetical protein
MQPQTEINPEVNTAPAASVSNMTWLLLAMTGLFFDTTGAILNLIPGAGQFLDEGNDLVADGVFLLWFKMNGMKYSKTTVFGSFIVKFIPLLNILPEYFLMIILLFLQARAKTPPPQPPVDTPNQHTDTRRAA